MAGKYSSGNKDALVYTTGIKKKMLRHMVHQE